ncbi:hypothetical protein CYMTET_33055, partial [Cymbomonas tetramitiformis]
VHPEVPLRLVLLRPENREIASKFKIHRSNCYALNEFKSNLLAQSMRCPGITTFLLGLTHYPSEVNTKLVATNSWITEYNAGTCHQIYGGMLREEFISMTFISAVEKIYNKCGALLVAVQREGRIITNPGKSASITINMVVFIIATSHSQLFDIVNPGSKWMEVFRKHRRARQITHQFLEHEAEPAIQSPRHDSVISMEETKPAAAAQNVNLVSGCALRPTIQWSHSGGAGTLFDQREHTQNPRITPVPPGAGPTLTFDHGEHTQNPRMRLFPQELEDVIETGMPEKQRVSNTKRRSSLISDRTAMMPDWQDETIQEGDETVATDGGRAFQSRGQRQTQDLGSSAVGVCEALKRNVTRRVQYQRYVSKFYWDESYGDDEELSTGDITSPRLMGDQSRKENGTASHSHLYSATTCAGGRYPSVLQGNSGHLVVLAVGEQLSQQLVAFIKPLRADFLVVWREIVIVSKNYVTTEPFSFPVCPTIT